MRSTLMEDPEQIAIVHTDAPVSRTRPPDRL